VAGEQAAAEPGAVTERTVRVISLVLDSLGAAIVAADAQDRILFWSKPAEALLGRRREDVIGHEFGALIVHRDAREQFAQDLEAVRRGESVHGDIAVVRPDGERLTVVLDRAPVQEGDGSVVGWVAWAVDAAEHRRRRREVEGRATQDPVTGLLNRMALEEQLRFALDRAAAQTDVAMAAVLIRLPEYADTVAQFGSSAGDRLLSDAAHRIRAALRAGDLLGRLAADEFLLVLPELRPGSGYGLEEWSRASGLVVTKKVQRALEAPFQVDGNERRLSGRIGIGIFPFDARDVAGILKAADAASRA
jgi:diguanylate cyclase (GGDEF)-like protein/PAS domain S-box-containing protein